MEMAETDSDLRNLGGWVPLSSTAGPVDTKPWSQTPGYHPVYSPRAQLRRSGSVSQHYRPVNTNYLNVQQFLEMELSRSREVRRRLREKSGDV